jgi:hypothetical protein
MFVSAAVYRETYTTLDLESEMIQVFAMDLEAEKVTRSPDHTRIVYTAETGDAFIDFALRVDDLTTGNTRFEDVYNSYSFMPAWSPDGNSLLVPLALNGLLRVDLATATQTNIISGQSVGEVAWQP